MFIIYSLINYLVGSIPFALIVGKLGYQTDVRNYGSGNLGATNTGRVLGKKAAFIVGFLDGFKGFILFIIESQFNYNAALLSIIFVAIGHCFPIFANFKGGKAVATTSGIILAISLKSITLFITLFVIPLAVWYFITKKTDYVSLASIVSVALTTIMSFIFADNFRIKICTLLLTALVIYKHKENIGRLISGTESKKNY